MTKEQSEPKQSKVPFETGPGLSELLEAFIGFDIKLWRTVRDLVIAPLKIAKNALAGDKQEYLGQVRLFVFLLGVQTLLFTLTRFYDAMQVQNLLSSQPEALESYIALLAEKGFTIKDVNNDLAEWASFSMTPLSALSTLLIAGFFKLLDRRYTIFGHILLVITITNAVTLVTMPLVLLILYGNSGVGMYSVTLLLLTMFYVGMLVWYFFNTGPVKVVIKVIAAVFFVLLTQLIIGMLLWAAANYRVEQIYGKGFYNHMIEHVIQKAKENKQKAKEQNEVPTEPATELQEEGQTQKASTQ